MPIFFSGAPREKPSSSACTTNIEIPRERASGSVTAITV